jgi:predicted CXXCH cytochrome family protein
MRVLSFVVSILILFIAGKRQDSPHGSDFKISCNVCHSPKGWELDHEIYSFDHNTTRLPLEGQHNMVNCRLCHPTLVFNEAQTDCSSCHNDMHYQTVGMDCARCHTPRSWIVENITDVHRQSRFPLQGPHFTAQCLDCHPSASLLRFEPLGVECVDCHMQDYQAAVNPSHVSGNFSTECMDCHSMTASTWGSEGFNHSFFPLTEGHALYDCNLCHSGSDYSDISTECFSCHKDDYTTTTNPNHIASGITTDCMECHTTMPGWKPATFDHTSFPLTQGHALNDCNLCHIQGNYSNVSTDCFSCHETDYNATTNPNHISAGIDNVCMECHTTMPGWKPATFDHTSFPLTQGHALNDCNLCHVQGNYSNVSTDCFSCHETDYNATTNPNHISAGIDNVCMECHTTMPGWKPATFTVHDALFFPIYSGSHNGEWNSCTECHSNPANYALFTCIDCHEHNRTSMDDKHSGENGYEYNSVACLDCHPSGRAD